MKFLIELTWSKVVALLVLIAAFWLSLENESIQAFTYSLPIIVFLITGKQFFNNKKEIQELKNGNGK